MDIILFEYIVIKDLINIILEYNKFNTVDLTTILKETDNFEEIDRFYKWKIDNTKNITFKNSKLKFY